MHSHQRRINLVNGTAIRIAIAHSASAQRDVRQGIDGASPSKEREPALGNFDLASFDRSDSLDQRLLAQSIFDDLLDRAHFQLMFSAQLFKIGKPSHVAVGIDDFDDRRGGVQSSEAAEIDRPFGLAGSNQNPTFAGSERIDMTRADQVVGAGRRIRQQLDGGRSIAGTDPRGHAVPRVPVDTDREGRLAQARIDRALWPEFESFARITVECHAEVATAHPSEKVDDFRRRILGRDHEVSFVLSVFVVDQNDHPTGLEVLDDLGDGFERHSGDDTGDRAV